MAELRRRCELCQEEATVYCPSDSAFMCTSCDDKVHRANFLVARHVRVRVCSHCRTLAGKSFAGVGVSSPGITKATCEKCCPLDNNDCLSSSSSCVSSTGTDTGEAEEGVLGSSTAYSASSGRKRIDTGDTKVEGVLVNWCRRVGVGEEDGRMVVKMAVEVLNESVGKMKIMPYKVMLATALWVAVRVCCRQCEMGRLEKVSGVPAKLILATESRLARIMKRARRAREDHEEGWAEC